MSSHLTFSKNSLDDTHITSDALNVHYEVSKHDAVVSVKNVNKGVVVGEYEHSLLKKDKIRLGQEEWKPLDDVLFDGSGTLIQTTDRSFIGNDGKTYRWKTHLGKTFMVDAANQNDDQPLVTYHHHHTSREPSYLAVDDSSVMPTLDNAVFTFVVMEKKHQSRQQQRRNAAMAHGGAS